MVAINDGKYDAKVRNGRKAYKMLSRAADAVVYGTVGQ
jgi:hypothetical protein